MCKVMEDMRKEAAEMAIEMTKLEHAEKLLKLGKLSFEEIADTVNLTVDEVEELSKNLTA